MQVSNSSELKRYALHRLGQSGVSPLLTVNVTTEQLDIIVDDVLQKFGNEHYDGFAPAIQVIPMVSGQGGYVLDERVIAVLYILPSVATYMSGEPLFSLDWELYQEKLWVGSEVDLTSYEILLEKLRLLQMYKVESGFTFNVTTHTLTIDSAPYSFGNYAIKCYVTIDPYHYEGIYNSSWVKKYMVACVGEQWGMNLTKFINAPLPGGATLNGEGILERYTTMKKDLEDELHTKYEEPPMFFVG